MSKVAQCQWGYVGLQTSKSATIAFRFRNGYNVTLFEMDGTQVYEGIHTFNEGQRVATRWCASGRLPKEAEVA